MKFTFYDALGEREDEYLIARAIQFFVPGIPQVYYVGLLAGSNDMELLARTGVGRDINRHYYTPPEIEDALKSPVVQKLIELIRLRNSHPAFAGQVHIENPTDQTFLIAWKNGEHYAKLDVDLIEPRALVTYSNSSAEKEEAVGRWDPQAGAIASEAI